MEQDIIFEFSAPDDIVPNGSGGGLTQVYSEDTTTANLDGTGKQDDPLKVNVISVPIDNIEQNDTHRFVTDTEKTAWNAKQNALGFTPVADTDPRLTDARTPTPHQHAMTDVTGLAAALSDKANSTDVSTSLSGKVDKITGKGLSTNDYTTAEKTKLAGLANYDDTAIQTAVSNLETNKANTTDLATVATSGSFPDLINKPLYEVLSTLPGDLSGYPDGSRIIITNE